MALKYQRNRANSASLPAPVGGWNARDAISDMEKNDAVILINAFPKATAVVMRKGSELLFTNAPTEMLIAYAGAATTQLFAIYKNYAGVTYYDTASNSVINTSIPGITNARWEYVNIATPGGNYVFMVNGQDSPLTYDGTSWTNPAITGVTGANLTNIALFKNRLWFTEKNTLKAWYLPTQSIAGAANSLDLSSFARNGGYLVAIGTWTIDAGYGLDDLIVFITNKGDTIVYRGTDPSSATTWTLVGVYELGSPIGKRCMCKYKGDLLVITQDGLFPLSGALQSSRLNPRVALTDKIHQAVSSAVSSYANNFGWQVIAFPKENMLILNVPVTEGNYQEQYVMNTITGAWCRFQNWNANVWEIYNDDLYFGASVSTDPTDTNGGVFKAWINNVDSGNIAINGNALQAFSYFGSPGQLKRFTMMRPTFYSNGSPSIQGTINVDFDQSPPISNLSVIPNTTSLWDSGVWDLATWQDEQVLARAWQGTTGIGYAGAPRLAFTSGTTTNYSLEWVSTDVVMEPGGIL